MVFLNGLFSDKIAGFCCHEDGDQSHQNVDDDSDSTHDVQWIGGKSAVETPWSQRPPNKRRCLVSIIL